MKFPWTICEVAGLVLTKLSSVSAQSWPTQSFKTTDFQPPQVNVTNSTASLAEGFVIITPLASFPAPNSTGLGAPLMLADSGDLVWFGPDETVSNLLVQTLSGQSVLTYFNGSVSNIGYSYGQVNILDHTYQALYTVCPHLELVVAEGSPSNFSCWADGHESYITERNTLLVTAINVTTADLTSFNGSSDGWVYDSMFYELNITTGEPIFQWSPIAGGIPINSSRAPLNGAGSKANPFDWFRVNAVQSIGDKYMVSSRHTSSIYLVNSTGQIEWTLDGTGNGGDFEVPVGGRFVSCFPVLLFQSLLYTPLLISLEPQKWQHHVRINTTTYSSSYARVSMFADNNTPWDNGTQPSTGLILDLDLRTSPWSATVITNLSRPEAPEYAGSQGSFTVLENNNFFMGYGALPFAREWTPSGDVAHELRFGYDNVVTSYRAFKEVWNAVPYWDPVCVGFKDTSSSTDGNGAVFMSWNGATDVDAWAIYGGATNDTTCFKLLGEVPSTGFETQFSLVLPDVTYVSVGAFIGGAIVRNSSVVAIQASTS